MANRLKMDCGGLDLHVVGARAFPAMDCRSAADAGSTSSRDLLLIGLEC